MQPPPLPELAPAQAALGVSTHVVYGALFPDPAGPLSSSTPGALSVGTAGDPATGLLPALKGSRITGRVAGGASAADGSA